MKKQPRFFSFIQDYEKKKKKLKSLSLQHEGRTKDSLGVPSNESPASVFNMNGDSEYQGKCR